jgi:WD40 repeat protein/serine/threonine protein kinase
MVMAQGNADRNLLFGLLALQTNLVDPAAIVAAFHIWTRDKSRSMGQVLIDQGAINSAQRDLLEGLVDVHVQKHGGDVEKSLASVGSAGAIREGLEAIADSDLAASLAHVCPSTNNAPSATQTLRAVESPFENLRFRILRFHARGGLGEVFVAHDEELHREVALKQIQDGRADDPASRSRFIVEAEITGSLEHPGIVPVYGLGRYDDGRPYYAMRLIKGESLRDAIKRFHQSDRSRRDPGARSLELRQLLRRFLDVCNAVAYAHSRGVLHRDLKPGNVMLGPYGETLVVDWGLAKVVGRPDTTQSETTLRPSSGSSLIATQAGAAIGTLAYMSPEQAMGDLEHLGPASDVYSLGATLYHLLTGQAAFLGTDTREVQNKVIGGDFPPPRQVQPAVPAALDAICRKAMALKPEYRYTSARRLADDIEHWLADEPVSALPESRSQRLARWARRRRVWAQAGAAALVVVSLVSSMATWFVNQARRRADEQRDRVFAEHEAGRRSLYAATIHRAHRAWQDAEIGRTLELLESEACQPTRSDQSDLRHWEWYYLRSLCHRDLNTFKSSSNHVYTVTFSKDGRLLVSAGQGNAVTVREAVSGQIVRILRWDDSIVCNIYGADISPDGRLLALSGSHADDGVIKVWEMDSGREVINFRGERRSERDVAFSPDGRLLASVGWDRLVHLWDTNDWHEVRTFRGHTAPILGVAFSPDGRKLASVSIDGSARLWNVAEGKEIYTLRGHILLVSGVAFAPDGNSLATSSEDETIKLWDVRTGRERATLRGHGAWVVRVTFSPDGRRLASASFDGTIKIWDVASGQQRCTFRGHTSNYISCVDFSPNGRMLASASNDGTVKLWDATVGSQEARILQFRNQSMPVVRVVFSPDGQRLASACRDGTVKLWERASGQEIRTFQGHTSEVWCVAFGPDGMIASGGDAGGIKLWKIASGHEIRTFLKENASRVRNVLFSPDKRLLAATYRDRVGPAIELWDVAGGREALTLRGCTNAQNSIAFSPDGHRLASTCDDGTIKFWDVAGGRVALTLQNRTRQDSSLAFSPDGRRLASASLDGMLTLWDMSSGQAIKTFRGHSRAVFCVAFSPDGRRLASASLDKTIKIWDTDSGHETLTLRGHMATVYSVEFSPDGWELASAGSGLSPIMLWDANSEGGEGRNHRSLTPTPKQANTRHLQ